MAFVHSFVCSFVCSFVRSFIVHAYEGADTPALKVARIGAWTRTTPTPLTECSTTRTTAPRTTRCTESRGTTPVCQRSRRGNGEWISSHMPSLCANRCPSICLYADPCLSLSARLCPRWYLCVSVSVCCVSPSHADSVCSIASVLLLTYVVVGVLVGVADLLPCVFVCYRCCARARFLQFADSFFLARCCFAPPAQVSRSGHQHHVTVWHAFDRRDGRHAVSRSAQISARGGSRGRPGGECLGPWFRFFCIPFGATSDTVLSSCVSVRV